MYSLSHYYMHIGNSSKINTTMKILSECSSHIIIDDIIASKEKTNQQVIPYSRKLSRPITFALFAIF